MSYRGVWTIAEEDQGIIREVSYELLTRGRRLADKLNVELSSVLIGSDITDDELNQLIYRGADKVYVIDDPRLNDSL